MKWLTQLFNKSTSENPMPEAIRTSTKEEKEKAELQALLEKQKYDYAFLVEHVPPGTEFMLLGVTFRVHKLNPPPRVYADAIYVCGKGKVHNETFPAGEIRTYFTEEYGIKILNGKYKNV